MWIYEPGVPARKIGDPPPLHSGHRTSRTSPVVRRAEFSFGRRFVPAQRENLDYGTEGAGCRNEEGAGSRLTHTAASGFQALHEPVQHLADARKLFNEWIEVLFSNNVNVPGYLEMGLQL